MTINIYEAIFTLLIYIVSLRYVYGLGYMKGGQKVLGEWRAFNNRMLEKTGDEE